MLGPLYGPILHCGLPCSALWAGPPDSVLVHLLVIPEIVPTGGRLWGHQEQTWEYMCVVIFLEMPFWCIMRMLCYTALLLKDESTVLGHLSP